MYQWFPSTAECIERPHAASTSWSAPGTCGEFVQGRLDGVDFLVNSPVDRFATARVRPMPHGGVTIADAAARPKASAALARLTDRLRFPRGFEIALDSTLPSGKGMASSTADLVATIGAALDQADTGLTVREIARLLVEVEPSDCTHVPGVGHVGHLSGQVFGSFATPPALRTLIVDCGGIVDTVAFDRARAHHVYARSEGTVRTLLSLALRSLAAGNAADLARAATMSARLNQRILFKPQLDELIAIAERHGGLGVCCAHSGSVVGLLYRPGADRGERLRRAVTERLGADAPIVGDQRFISGGIYVHRR